MSGKRYTPEIIAEMKRLKAEGMRNREIARRLDATDCAVSYHVSTGPAILAKRREARQRLRDQS